MKYFDLCLRFPSLFIVIALCNAHQPGPKTTSGPTVIKLLESENVLKYKNRLHDFINTEFIFKLSR